MKIYYSLLAFSVLFFCIDTGSASFAQNKNLPKKAKEKIILYKDANMIGIGYVHKKQFVENQKVTFISNPFYDDYRYRIKKKDGKAFLHFNRSNKDLSTSEPFISGVYINRNDTPFIKGEMHPYYRMTCEGTFMFYNAKQDNKYILSPSTTGVEVFYFDVSGTKSYRVTDAEYEIHGEKQGNEYSVSVDFSDKSKILSLETQATDLMNLQRFDLYNPDFWKELKPVEINYTNGDQFIGTVGIITTDDNGYKLRRENIVPRIVPLNGEYTYHTGETFVGEYSPIRYVDGKLRVPKGKITFSDGSIAPENWLSQYDFTSEEWRQIYNDCKSLTEIRDMSAQLEERKRQKEERERQERIAEQREKKRRELLKRLKEEARRRNILSKYGAHYGNLILERELELGMTQAMVNEIWKKDWFDHSISTSFRKRIDTWTFNINKVQMFILSGAKSEKELQGAAIFLGVLDIFSPLITPTIPKTLIFINDELTDIYY